MNDIQRVRFDKDISKIVKGFALVFMMILHCYCKTEYDTTIDDTYSLVKGFRLTFKICVGMFVFMVGYGYAYSKEKDLRYSFQHIKRLLIPYWVILFVFTFPLCFKQVFEKGLIFFVYNLFGIDSTLNNYSWFVYFFIFAMVVMPIISKFINKKPVRNAIIAIIIFFLIGIVLHELYRFFSYIGIPFPKVIDNKPLLVLVNCCSWTPTMILGYLFAHEGYYERIRNANYSGFFTFLFCICIIVLSFVLKCYTYNDHNPFHLDFFFAPLVIGSIAVLFNRFNWTCFRRMMLKIGEMSVYMWFFHALFFTAAVRWFYQPIITVFNDINLVVLWTILLTFFASWLIKSIVDIIDKCILKIIAKK